MRGLVGLLALVALLGSDRAALANRISPTFVIVGLQLDHTTAERVAIQHRLAADPRAGSVQYVTRGQQLTAIAHWDANVARAIQHRLEDLICVKPRGARAADGLVDLIFKLHHPAVHTVDEGSSGGQELYPCGYTGLILGEVEFHK